MKKILITIIALLTILPSVSYAHQGRTDSSGGHYNRSTGKYHYHHGYSAHQHVNGICPYEDNKEENNEKSSWEKYKESRENNTEKFDINKLQNLEKSNLYVENTSKVSSNVIVTTDKFSDELKDNIVTICIIVILVGLIIIVYYYYDDKNKKDIIRKGD